jgi:hypothetical protein
MAQFETLYGKNCQVPLYWGWTEEGRVNKSGQVCIMTDKVKLVKERLRADKRVMQITAVEIWNSKLGNESF